MHRKACHGEVAPLLHAVLELAPAELRELLAPTVAQPLAQPLAVSLKPQGLERVVLEVAASGRSPSVAVLALNHSTVPASAGCHSHFFQNH